MARAASLGDEIAQVEDSLARFDAAMGAPVVSAQAVRTAALLDTRGQLAARLKRLRLSRAAKARRRAGGVG